MLEKAAQFNRRVTIRLRFEEHAPSVAKSICLHGFVVDLAG
jgi:hypothetical protein